MGGKHSRTKGHSFERKIAQMFRENGYPHAQRQLEYQLNQCKGIDLSGTGHYAVQCKKTKAYVSVNTIKEIQSDFKVPVLVTAADREEAMVVLPLWKFLELISLEKKVQIHLSDTIKVAENSKEYTP